jgi:hypothetical protein
MIDGGVLAGYLAVAATRAAGQVFDKTVDGLFDRLAQRVTERLGGQALAGINANPGSTYQQRQVGQSIDAAARVDPRFAAELAQIQRRLDQLVGRQMISIVNAQTNVQALGGRAYGGGHNYALNMSDQADHSKAPSWVKVLVVVGLLIALVGFGMAFVGILSVVGSISGATQVDPPDLDEILPGFGLFFVGIVVMVIASVGKAISRRR